MFRPTLTLFLAIDEAVRPEESASQTSPVAPVPSATIPSLSAAHSSVRRGRRPPADAHAALALSQVAAARTEVSRQPPSRRAVPAGQRASLPLVTAPSSSFEVVTALSLMFLV